MSKVVVLIIASQGYQPIEYGNTRKVLEDAGVSVVVASDKIGTAHAGSKATTDHPQSASAQVDLTIDQIDPAKYDGIFIIGGPGALEFLDNQATYKIMRQAAQLGKPFGAICVSPRILAQAGLLRDKRATGWDVDNQLTELFNHYGVTYVKEPVVTDGYIVTANGPRAATDFGKSIVAVIR